MGAGKRLWVLLGSRLPSLFAALMRVAWLAPLLAFLLDSELVAPRGVPFPPWLILLLLLSPRPLAAFLKRCKHAALLGTLIGLIVVGGVVAFCFRIDVAHLAQWAEWFVASQGDFYHHLPAVLVVVMAAAGMWWRGLTAKWNDYSQLYGGFVVGVMVLGGLMLVARPEAWLARGLNAWLYGLTFVLSALVSLALLSTQEMLSWERFRGRGGPGLSRYWLTAVGGLVGLLILLGWGISETLSTGIWQALRRLGQPVEEVLMQVVEHVLLASGYIAFEVFGGLIAALKALVERNWDLILRFLRRILGDPAKATEGIAQSGSSMETSVRILFWLGLTLIVGVAFYVAFRRYKSLHLEGEREDREFILSKELLQDQLQTILRGLRRRRPTAAFIRLDDVEDARRIVRELYRRTLSLLAVLGYARSPSDTPLTYEENLARIVQRERQALSELTEAYVVARYAPDPPSAQQVQEAVEAFHRLEGELEKKRARP